MAGFSYNKKPKYSIFCPTCAFITSVEIYGDKLLKTVDVYRSCQPHGDEFILNYSDEPGDYSTVSLEQLFAYHTLGHFGEVYKQFMSSVHGG